MKENVDKALDYIKTNKIMVIRPTLRFELGETLTVSLNSFFEILKDVKERNGNRFPPIILEDYKDYIMIFFWYDALNIYIHITISRSDDIKP